MICSHLPTATPVATNDIPIFPEATSIIPPELLFLIHPLLLNRLQTLVCHVIRLKSQLSTATPGTEKAKLAHQFFAELVNSLGVDLAALPAVLDELIKDTEGIDGRPNLYHCWDQLIHHY
jgi:hypothetical protein